jgi:hypothetical protein
MLQESTTLSPAKEQRGGKWWFYTPKESNGGWVVVPDSGAAAIPALSTAAVRLHGSGTSAIKGLLREASLLSGADAVDAVGQQVCAISCLLTPDALTFFAGWHVRWPF